MSDGLGDRISAARRAVGLSQKDLAKLMNRSESWVSQVERGVLPVERIALLQQLADVLEIGVLDLKPEIAYSDSTAVDLSTNLEDLRLAITGHPSLLGAGPELGHPLDYDDLAARVEEAWDNALASNFESLADFLPQMEHAVRIAPNGDRLQYLGLLARTYQAVSFSFAGQGESDAAWVAADRAIQVAAETGDDLQILAGHFRLAHTFIRLRRNDQAKHLAEQAIDVLRPRATSNATPDLLALYGAMHLVRAVLAGFDQDRALAHQYLDEADRIGDRVSDGPNYYNTEFGPTNVKLHRVAIALDLGDAGEALDVAATADPSAMSTERQLRLQLDIARAHLQRRHVTKAIEAMTTAERIHPATFASHHLALSIAEELRLLATGQEAELVVDLSRRMGAH